ncbi:MAG: ion transporter [Spirochaetaceae bacterium]|nr:ion transporter [Spirochaetaceae bacterium]
MIRKRVFEILDKGKNGDIFSILFDSLILFFIISTVSCVFFSTFTLPDIVKKGFAILETAASIVFSIEYILRLWTAPELFPALSAQKARIKYARSFIAIIDLITILPFYIALFSALPPAIISSISLLRVLRLFKLSRYSSALYVLVDVIKSRAQELSLSVFVIFVLMIIS